MSKSIKINKNKCSFEKYSNLHIQNNFHGGNNEIVTEFTKINNVVYKVNFSNKGNNYSFYIKFFSLPHNYSPNIVEENEHILTNGNYLELTPGYYEALVYKKLNNLTEDDSNINIVKLYDYGIIDKNITNKTFKLDDMIFDIDISEVIDQLLFKNQVNKFFYFTTEHISDNIMTFFDYYNNNSLSEYKLILKEATKALKYAYKKFGFIHCDLHINNILYDTVTRKIYFFDFGYSEISNNNIGCMISNIDFVIDFDLIY